MNSVFQNANTSQTQSSFPAIYSCSKQSQKKTSKTMHISTNCSPIKKKKNANIDKKLTLVSLNRSLPKYTSIFNKKIAAHSIMSFNNLQMVSQLFHQECDVSKSIPLAFFKKSTLNMSTKSIKQCVILTRKQSKKMNRQNIIQSQFKQKRTQAKKQIDSILFIFYNPDAKQVRDPQQIYKAIKAFKKAERHLVLKFYFTKILFHHLTYEVCVQIDKIDDAIHALCFCEYYARKSQLNSYIIPCLIAQSELWFSIYELSQTLKCVKSALQFSVVLRHKEAELRILQKIGIIYYYIGNSYMARYYDNLSQKGLQTSQFEIYRKQYSKIEQLKSLQHKIFHFPAQKMNKRKHNEKYQLDLSRDLIQDNYKLEKQQKQLVTSMLKNQNQVKNGIIIRKIMNKNSQHAKIKIFDKNKQSIISNFQPSLQNCTQVMKVHLSKNRIAKTKQKNIDFRKTLWLLQKYKYLLQQHDYDRFTNTTTIKNDFKATHLR